MAPNLIRFKALRKNFEFPEAMSQESAGFDLRACLEAPVTIPKRGGVKVIPLGFQMEMPNFMEAQIRPRSGLAAKKHVTVLNSPGTIDADYRGEVGVILINHHSEEDFIVDHGDRIAQMVFARVEINPTSLALNQWSFSCLPYDSPEALSGTERGNGGFGSTGV